MAGIAYGTPRGRGILLATVLGSGVAFLDGTIVNVALPAIGRGLEAGLGALEWIVEAYLLTFTAFLLPGGAAGDRFGRRKVFVLGLASFAIVSVLCGLAPSAVFLVIARAAQGIAAALLVPGSLAVLRACFRPEDEGRAIGAWAGLSGVAAAVGPLAGGWLAEAVSWRAIFLVNLPLAAIAIWAALRYVPESRDPAPAPLDLAGAGLTILGLGAAVLALVGATEGRHGTAAWAVVGACALAAFLVLESRRAAPMLPLSLFRSRPFSGANATTLAVYFALGGAMFLVTLQLQRGLGWSPIGAGAALTPVTLLVLVLSPASGRLAARFGARAFMTVGSLVIAAGLLSLGRVQPGARYLSDVLPGVVALGFGLGITVAPLTTAVMEAAPPEHAGIASGVNNAVARLAGLLSVAALPLAGGISPESFAAGDFTSGYARAMAIAAAVAAAGGLVAFWTVPPALPRAPARGTAHVAMPARAGGSAESVAPTARTER